MEELAEAMLESPKYTAPRDKPEVFEDGPESLPVFETGPERQD